MNRLIDRRLNGRGKSTVNRERFLRRYKQQVRAEVKRMVGERKVEEMDRGGDVHLPKKDIAEPNFNFGHGGDREFVLPGNREYVAGDRIPRPTGEGEGGSGGGGAGSDGEETRDEFVFSLSREEFLDIFFDDLELPRLIRTQLSSLEKFRTIRTGYTTQGSPSNLSVPRTLGNALARRIALNGARQQAIALLEAQHQAAIEQGRT